jgi:hypothetical protein
MAFESDGKIRLEFTGEELIYLHTLVWEKLKEAPSPAAADWSLVRLLSILHRGLRPRTPPAAPGPPPDPE